MSKDIFFTLGIDATSIRGGGGGVTHLVELLRAVDPSSAWIQRVVIWGNKDTLAAIDNRSWLEKRNPPALDKSMLHRILWQYLRLSQEARKAKCDVLFVPGGSFLGNFKPTVTMSQNLLPFDWGELLRYGLSLNTLRFLLLRWIQGQSFRRSEGVIFLTKYAQQVVEGVVGVLQGKVAVIPHGFNKRFSQLPREQLAITAYVPSRPYRMLYVSTIDHYKHQWQVVSAVGRLRDKMGWQLQLDFVGPAYPPALRRFEQAVARWDPKHQWINYYGQVPYDELHQIYQKSDMGLWASTCETFGIVLLESMAAGLPIASSNYGPMPEVLSDSAVYFDPESVEDMVQVLAHLILNLDLRTQNVLRGFELVHKYDWDNCAKETFRFFVEIITEYEKLKN
jgi:glycosyltransferase involved in cell wall biosynthesis